MITDNFMTEQSRFDVLLNKFTKPFKNEAGKIIEPIMNVNTYINIIIADPTTIVDDSFILDDYSPNNLSRIKKVGEYSQWLIKNYVKPELVPYQENLVDNLLKIELMNIRRIFMEDLFKVTEDLIKFTKYKKYLPKEDRDINKYTPKSLYEYLSNFEVPEKFKTNEIKSKIRKERVGLTHPGATIDFVGEHYTVIKITDKGTLGQEAASWYGGYYDHEKGESKWCTSPVKSSNFKYYIEKGPLYVIFPNDDKGNLGQRTGLPVERYQFHFQDNQFKDRQDFDVNLHSFFTGNGSELKEYFKPEFIKNIKSINGQKIEVEYPSDSASKFISIYGFADFFNGIPNDITNLLFNNKSANNFSLEIPKSIVRFQNLEVLMFMNCIEELPKEIGELSNLQFISLPNNPNLKTIPNSILNLKKLKFITLKNTPVTLSKEILEKFTEMGKNTSFYTKKDN